jgi:hypothetical protein
MPGAANYAMIAVYLPNLANRAHLPCWRSGYRTSMGGAFNAGAAVYRRGIATPGPMA